MAEASMKSNLLALDWVPCIYYLILLKKNDVKALIDPGIKINAMTPAYALKLGLKICITNIRA